MTHRVGNFRQHRLARLLGGNVLDRAGGGAARIGSIDDRRCRGGRRRVAGSSALTTSGKASMITMMVKVKISATRL